MKYIKSKNCDKCKPSPMKSIRVKRVGDESRCIACGSVVAKTNTIITWGGRN